MESMLQVDMSFNQESESVQTELPQQTTHDPESLEPSTTRALLLNHRIAYTRKRERASLGITLMESIMEPDDWMLPLASGYLIHSPSKNENASMEQLNYDPLIIEVHPERKKWLEGIYVAFYFLGSPRMQPYERLSISLSEEHYQTIPCPFVCKSYAIPEQLFATPSCSC